MVRKSTVTLKDIVRAVKSRREATGGAIGPTLRELDQALSISYASVQTQVRTLVDLELLSCIWASGDENKMIAHSLDVTAKGLDYISGTNGA